MVDLLRPRDIIESAAVPGHPGLYVVGSYDRRITFYSQQVRALSLIHALNAEGYLKANKRIAVVGGGAAGMTIAAAVALVTQSEVVLFESHQELLPLQSATSRRNLDPHIFDWPEWDTDDPIADLPILDWKAGPARNVRADVAFEFEGIVAALTPRLRKRTRETVKAINPVNSSFELIVERDAAAGEGPSLRVERPDRFELVFLAIGFGLEPAATLPGVPNHSYWSDAGVPLEEFAGRPHPRFLISGNGDGALIDMVAAGSAAFDHARMIRTIVTHPGISEIFAHLRSIDERARAADGRGERFDFVAAYDAEILPAIEAIGILGAVAGLLRPGVHLTLQTQHPEMFVVTTSALNRLAAYVMTKVCLRAPQSAFLHLHCADVRVVEPPRDRTYQALYWLDCGGTIVGADSVIVRRGPDRASSRAPFDNVLAGFEVAHTAWLARHGDATLVPRLSSQARELFEIAAKTTNIPLARHVQEARAEIRIETIQVRPIHPMLRWSGTLAPQDMVAAWRNDGARFDIVCPAPPGAYGPVAAAIIRLAAHGQQCKIIADPGQWRQFAGGLSSESLHAEGLQMPDIGAGIPGAVNRDPVELDPVYLASALHDSLDRWTIDAIDRHIDDYLATGRDASARVGFVASLALRHQMRAVWQRWKVNFDANPALLARFFRLLTCALDDDGSIEIAHVLVGPAKLTPLIRGTAVALAIATGWQTTAPHLNRPGNLLRQRDNATTWSGHTCAADQIDGKAMSLAAASFMWRTQFVILSVRGSVDLASQAEERFSITKSDQPGISDPAGAGQILMSIDAAFIAAAEAGPAALAGLLERVERTHFERLEEAIVIMAREDERA